MALHTSAQLFLATGIGQFDPTLQVVVSSHSPAFLDHRDFRLHHVHRGRDGRTEATPLEVSELATARSLGMAPADLFQHIRVFMVVESRHDERILGACIGDRLHGLGALIVPMSGGTQLAAVLGSRLIFDWTDARVLVVLDNIETATQQVWNQALREAMAGSIGVARTTLEQGLKKDGEQGFLRNFGIRAVDRGRWERERLWAIEGRLLGIPQPGCAIARCTRSVMGSAPCRLAHQEWYGLQELAARACRLSRR